MLYDESSALFVLGSLCNDTSLLNDEHPLNKSDFKLKQFDKIIFTVIVTLKKRGAKSLNPEDFVEFLKAYSAQEEIFNDNDGVEFIRTIKSMNKEESYEVYYNNVRKFSLLNSYKENNVDISKFYDETISEAKALENLNKYSIEDIINHYDTIQADIKSEFLGFNDDITQMVCGDGFDELLDELEKDPLIGAGLTSVYLNALYRGWCKGHLLLRGSPSSGGKSCLGIAELNNTSCLKIWSDEYQDFIDNPCYQGMGAYVHTEQKSREEIQTRFISNIANVPYHIILDGSYTKQEKARLSKAGEIAKQSEILIFNYPKFNATGIELLCKKLKAQGVEYFVDDYIWDNFYLTADLKKLTSQPIRQDMALLHYTNTLKMCAEQNDMAIATSIQLNGKEKEFELVDESCLFGSKSVKTKLDGGSIFMPPRKKELEQAMPLIDLWNKNNGSKFGEYIIPNRISHIFKGRYNRYGLNLKVWHYFDTSTGRMLDMFVTNSDNTPTKERVEPLYITNKKEG